LFLGTVDVESQLGRIIAHSRGGTRRAAFARQLGYSYTYIRSLELGLRLPSDDVLLEIARRLGLDPDELIIAAYCDRSPALCRALSQRGSTEQRALRLVEG
jgi:transcriptional regulator with XRE-family HTH domain